VAIKTVLFDDQLRVVLEPAWFGMYEGAPLLKIRQLQKSYRTDEGPNQVLKNVDLDLAAGVSLALTGESGSGKSTLLHLVAGLDRPDAGQILIDGQSIVGLGDSELATVRRSTVALVFQQFNLIPSLDVASNVSFQARLAGRADPAWLKTLTEHLGLSDYLRRYPEQLSGGQQQRVAIGRALAVQPKVILADEPTGNLDEATGDTVLELMLSLVASSGASLIMATHSNRLAARLDRRIHLHAGQVT
jgi:putative ABC transport system ATP-binding protein